MDKSKDSAMNLNKPFLYIIKLFHYIGISAYSRSPNSNNWLRWWHLKWCYFNIFLFLAVHFIIIYFHRKLFYTADRFGTFNDFIKVLTVGMSHLVTLIETARHQKSALEFFQTYTTLHQHWADYRKTKNELKIYKKFFLLTLTNILVLCLVDFNYAIAVGHKPQWISFFVAYEPSVWICRFRFIQISMYLALIKTEIVQLNKEILTLAKNTQRKGQHYDENFICQKLHTFMRNYQQIFLMVELFKKGFSVSCLVIFVSSYVKILSDCYWIYWVIYNQDELLAFAEYSLLIPTVLNMFLLLFMSQDCMRSAKLIPNSLHSIWHNVENLKLSNKIQNFSLQLCHQPIIIDACGCFVVDCYIVSGILGSITTYMIFYIEFMPKFKNL